MMRQLSTLDFGASASDMVEYGEVESALYADEGSRDRLSAVWKIIEKAVICRLYKINQVILVN